MAELPSRTRVRDVELMRALAHPLRSALLNYLMAVGPRTASECAAAVDSTASNCSWHLRQLGNWGLVERAEATDGRERPWRATQVGLDFGDLDGDLAVRTAQLAAVGTTVATDRELAERFVDTVDELAPEWQRVATFNAYSLRLSPDELAALNAAIDALVRPYVTTIRTDAPPEARTVHGSWKAFPRIEADGTFSS